MNDVTHDLPTQSLPPTVAAATLLDGSRVEPGPIVWHVSCSRTDMEAPAMMTTVLSQLKAGSKVGVYLLIAFLALSFWQDPSGSADALGNVAGGIASFCATVVDKLAEFIKSLTD
jgi:hypothetical protein